MPYISVCVPTMRVGGLDILFEGLKGQTFTDFELVLADGLYKYRRDVVAEKAEAYGIRVKHVEPFENPFPMNAFSRYANTALAYADCELVMCLTDYTWIPTDSLQIHADFHKRVPYQGLMSPHQYTVTPKIHPDFPCYKSEDTDLYVADLEAGKLQETMWSLFEKPYVSLDPLGIDPIMGGADPKLFIPSGPIIGAYFHGKHESLGLRYLTAVNGWDEDLDGTHCYQDTELAGRLEVRAGLTWQAAQEDVAYIINPRHVFPWARRLRPAETNHVVWQAKKAAGYPIPNTWNLKGHV